MPEEFSLVNDVYSTLEQGGAASPAKYCDEVIQIVLQYCGLGSSMTNHSIPSPENPITTVADYKSLEGIINHTIERLKTSDPTSLSSLPDKETLVAQCTRMLRAAKVPGLVSVLPVQIIAHQPGDKVSNLDFLYPSEERKSRLLGMASPPTIR